MSKTRILLPLLLLIFLDSFGYFLVIPVFIRLIYDAQLSILPVATTLAQRNIIMSMAVASGFLAMMVSAPYVGRLSDKYGRKKIFLVCLVISLIGFIVPLIGLVYQSITLIILGRFVASVGSASEPVVQAAIADIATGKQKALFLSLIAFTMTMALLLGPLAGGYLSDAKLFHEFSVATPYWVGIIVVVINIILLKLFFRETHLVGASLVGARDNQVTFAHRWASIKLAPTKILFAIFLLEFAWSLYYNAIVLYLGQKYFYSPEQVSNFAAYLGALMCIGLVLLQPILLKYFSIEKILKSSVVFLTLGFIGCAFISGVTTQWLCAIPITLFTGISYVALLSIVSSRTPAEQQGWMMGVAMTVLAAAWFITSLISGWLLNIYIDLPLIIAAIVAVFMLGFTMGTRGVPSK